MARRTSYNGIEMRSRLEAGFAAWMDLQGLKWEYEPKAFASSTGQYLPDFRIDNLLVLSNRNGKMWGASAYVEVKPFAPIDFDPIIRQMELVWESDAAATLLLVWPGLCHPSNSDPAALRLHGIADRDGNYLRNEFLYWRWIKTRDGVCLGGGVLTEKQSPWPDEYWKPETDRSRRLTPSYENHPF